MYIDLINPVLYIIENKFNLCIKMTYKLNMNK